ncbi:hypothetical protein GCM10009557_43580 [Virgisporangium ochraceum]|uniref:Acid-resistance membrane protein n=2 Tax=Virgisporangium ochraceum TaxID=65505 RepID=A0A8J4A0Z7_9ACTN|nr:hypothetical protein Voc01_075240 [Virgisporangium ochraceum]
MRDSGLFPWWSLVALGTLSVLVGVVALAWPDATLRVLAWLAGVWVVISGLMRIFGAFVTGRGVGRQVLSGIVGVVLVLIGAACLRDLVTSVALLSVVVAMTWLLSGIAEAVMSVDAKGRTRTALAVIGVVSILIGLTFLFVPELSLFVLVVMTGLGFVATGALQVVVGFQLRRPGDGT